MTVFGDLAFRLCQSRAASVASDSAELAKALGAAISTAEERWPELTANRSEFVNYLAPRLPGDLPISEALDACHVVDLYLAWGCSRAEPAALLLFERNFIGEVGSYVARVERAAAFADDVRQALREKLLDGTSRAAGITAYSGRSALGAWVRVAALRVALNLRRTVRRRETAEQRAGAAELRTGLGPELEYLQGTYREVFAEALEAAAKELSSRDRVLLRLYHAEGTSLEALGALYRVHPSTISRWLACAREELAETTMKLLRGRLGVGATDAGSIAALVMSQLDVSFTRLFGTAE